MRLSCGEYKQNIKLKVPYNYPEEGVEVDFVSSNFPADIQLMFKSQAEEIVRRCEAGFSPEQVLEAVNNPVKVKRSQRPRLHYKPSQSSLNFIMMFLPNSYQSRQRANQTKSS